MEKKIGKLGTLGEISRGREEWWIVDNLNNIIEKQNEIIDYLNSQDQEEDILKDTKLFSSWVHNGKKWKEDTPEEWVEKLWELIDVYRNSKDINSELEGIEEVNQYVKQLLDERETKAFNEGVKEMEDSEQIQADWDIEELGNIVDKIVKKLDKLNKKK